MAVRTERQGTEMTGDEIRSSGHAECLVAYLRNFDEDDEMGPACAPDAPPTAMVSGAAFSSDMSCRRLKSFNLPAVNCDVPFVGGGLFSTFTLTLSSDSSFKSGFAEALFASFDDVDEDDDAGLPSEIMEQSSVSVKRRVCREDELTG